MKEDASYHWLQILCHILPVTTYARDRYLSGEILCVLFRVVLSGDMLHQDAKACTVLTLFLPLTLPSHYGNRFLL